MDKNVQRIRDIQYFGEMGGVVPDINNAATTTFLDPDAFGGTSFKSGKIKVSGPLKEGPKFEFLTVKEIGF